MYALIFLFNGGVVQWVNDMTRGDKNPGSNPGHSISAMCCTLLSGEEWSIYVGKWSLSPGQPVSCEGNLVVSWELTKHKIET